MPSGTANSSVRNEQMGLAREQSGLGRRLVDQGASIMSTGTPAYTAGMNYYKNLLMGNPSGLAQAMQPETGMVNQMYQGALKNLEFSGARGGQREQAKTNLSQQKTNQLASIVPGLRQGAADKSMQGGMAGMQLGQESMHTGSTAMGNAGLTYANLLNDESSRNAASRGMWGNLGSSLGKMLLQKFLFKGLPVGGAS